MPFLTADVTSILTQYELKNGIPSMPWDVLFFTVYVFFDYFLNILPLFY